MAFKCFQAAIYIDKYFFSDGMIQFTAVSYTTYHDALIHHNIFLKHREIRC